MVRVLDREIKRRKGLNGQQGYILLCVIFFGPFCFEDLSNIQVQTEEGKMMRKQRRLSVKLGIMLVIIGLVAIQTEAHGNSWKWEFFYSDAECDFFYDPDTVFRSQKVS